MISPGFSFLVAPLLKRNTYGPHGKGEDRNGHDQSGSESARDLLRLLLRVLEMGGSKLRAPTDEMARDGGHFGKRGDYIAGNKKEGMDSMTEVEREDEKKESEMMEMMEMKERRGGGAYLKEYAQVTDFQTLGGLGSQRMRLSTGSLRAVGS